MAAAKASVLPPAPAQISSTCWRGPAPAISAAICEPSSCTSYQPSPCPVSASTLGCRPGALRRRQPHADRRQRRRHGREARQRLQHLVAVGLERVDAQIDRGAAGQRRAFLGRRRAEGAREGGLEPVGIVAAHRRPAHRPARARDRPACSASLSGSRACGEPSALAIDGRGRQAQRAAARRPARCARGRVAVHLRGERPPAAQGVVDEVADGGAVAGAGEAVALAPVGERGRRRPVPAQDLLEHLDGGLDVGARPHGLRPARPSHVQEQLDPHDGHDQEARARRPASASAPCWGRCGWRRARRASARTARPARSSSVSAPLVISAKATTA